MKTVDTPRKNDVANGHAADVSIRIGTRVTFDASVTSAGLLSIGALVTGILLSTAVVVVAAGRKGTKSPLHGDSSAKIAG